MIYFRRDAGAGTWAIGLLCLIGVPIVLFCMFWTFGLMMFAAAYNGALAASLFLLELLFIGLLVAALRGVYIFLLSPPIVRVTNRGLRIGNSRYPWPYRREQLTIVEKRKRGGYTEYRVICEYSYAGVRMRAIEAVSPDSEIAEGRKKVEEHLDQVWEACERARRDATDYQGADAQK